MKTYSYRKEAHLFPQILRNSWRSWLLASIQWSNSNSLHFTFFAHSDKQIQRRGFFTHLTSTIICYEGIHGLSDASYFQWAAYLLRVCAVSSELRYSLIFIFLSVFIFYSNTNMSWVLFQLGDVSYFDVFLSRHLSCVMFLVTLFETPPITFFFLSTHFLFLQFWKLPIYIGICISLVFAVFFPHLNTFFSP